MFGSYTPHDVMNIVRFMLSPNFCASVRSASLSLTSITRVRSLSSVAVVGGYYA